MKEQVLQAMREAGKPVSAGEVTKALGADRKEVDKAFAELKKEGAIVSPVRCKWAPAQYLERRVRALLFLDDGARRNDG